MTLRCECGGAVSLVGSNGTTDPSRDRFEHYECGSCGQRGFLRLGSDGSETLSGCLRGG
jgi:hypothetical protein